MNSFCNTFRQRAVMILGQTGNGKSLLCRTITGDESIKISDNRLSCTKDCGEYEVGGIVFIDTPGTGDIVEEGQKPLSNHQILKRIYLCAIKYEVVCVVFMLGLSDITNSRANNNTEIIIKEMSRRFNNFPLICQYAIDNRFNMLTMEKLLEIYRINSATFCGYGLHLDNVHLNGYFDFSSVIRAVDRCVQRESPEKLRTSPYSITCRVCKKEGDPFEVDEVCKTHGNNGSNRHGKEERYHPEEKVNKHTGTVEDPTCRRKRWTCCKEPVKDARGCKLLYDCCDQSSSYGCRAKCINCRRDTRTEGCLGTCANCKKLLSSEPCIRYQKHDWGLNS